MDTNKNDTDGGLSAADNTIYTATFTLTQEGMDGDVVSSLTCSPELDVDNPAFVHVAMSEIGQLFLYRAGIIDKNGELMVPTEELEDGGLRVVDTGTTKH